MVSALIWQSLCTTSVTGSLLFILRHVSLQLENWIIVAWTMGNKVFYFFKPAGTLSSPIFLWWNLKPFLMWLQFLQSVVKKLNSHGLIQIIFLNTINPLYIWSVWKIGEKNYFNTKNVFYWAAFPSALHYLQLVDNAKSGLEMWSPTKANVTFSFINNDSKSNTSLGAWTLCGTSTCNDS